MVALHSVGMHELKLRLSHCGLLPVFYCLGGLGEDAATTRTAALVWPVFDHISSLPHWHDVV